MIRLCLAAVFLASAVVARADTLIVVPDSGAFPVSQPQSLQYPEQSLLVSQGTNSLLVSTPGSSTPRWTLSISAPQGGTLVPGCYERGRRFATANRPAIDFSFGSSGCNETDGRFRILDLQRSGGQVTSLAVDFVQQCGPLSRAIQGKLRYNSAVPTDTVSLRPVFDPSGSMSFNAQPGAIGGGSQGNSVTFTLSRQNFRASRNFDAGVSASFDGVVPGTSSPAWWSLDFAAADAAPLAVGSYPNATRFPFQAAGEPGFAFGYTGAGCNTLVAAFVVTEVNFDALDGGPRRFAATFDQRCPAAASPLTSGSISFDMNITGPTSASDPQIVFASGMEAGEGGFYTASCDN